jgi:hypothetical protein
MTRQGQCGQRHQEKRQIVDVRVRSNEDTPYNCNSHAGFQLATPPNENAERHSQRHSDPDGCLVHAELEH